MMKKPKRWKMKRKNWNYLDNGRKWIACSSLWWRGEEGSSSSSPSVVEGNVSEQVARMLRKEQGFAQRLADELTFLREAMAAVSGVVVRIRNTELASQTDDSGFFRLEGEFEGDVILDFQLPDASVSLQISVPNGGRVILQDITINTTSGQAVPTQTIVDDSSDDDSNSNGNDDSNTNDAGSNSNSDDSNSNDDSNNSNDDDSNSNDDSSNSNSDDDSNSNSDDSSNSNDDDSNSNDDSSNSNSDSNSNDDSDDDSNSNSGNDDSDDDDSQFKWRR
jgi:hypothetical protein